MSNKKLTRLFMSKMTPEFWQKQADKKALKVFKVASEEVLAYKKVLEENDINPKEITSIADFEKLPILDKKSYIKKFSLHDLVLGGELKGKYTIEKSAGTTGGSFFWPRLAEEDESFPKYIEYAFVQFYKIDKLPTLVILTLALGTWTSGEKMAQALRMSAVNKKYQMTVVTPGANQEEVLEIVKHLSKEYQQTVIVGYPPFLKNVIDEGERGGIDWKGLNLKLGLGGEGYSEKWREYMAKKIGLSEKDLLGISGGYGAADVGMSVGREYPITVLMRKLAYKDKKLAKALFGEEENLPSLMQFNPSSFFIEEIKGELVFTVKAGIPLVRYNIHDRGGVISFDRAVSILRAHGYDILKLLKDYGYQRGDIWRLPFFYVYGRSDGTISVGGANIYPENIDAALYNKETAQVNSFKLKLSIDDDFNTRPCILVELCKNYRLLNESEVTELRNRLHRAFLKRMLKINSDYSDAYRVDQKGTDPIIKIYEYGKGPFAKDKNKIKRTYVLKQ